MFVTCSEKIWSRGVSGELWSSSNRVISLYADNTSVIQIVVNLVFHERTKHVEVDCHSTRDMYDD